MAVILALLIGIGPLPAYAEGDETAQELTKQCEFDFGAYEDADQYVLNNSVQSYATFRPGTVVTVSWTEDVPVASLCLQWFEVPTGVRIIQRDADGTELSNELLASNPESIVPIESRARSLELRIEIKKEKLSQLHVFGAGTLPEPFFAWLETPDHLDYLLIATHPDDDVLYLGSVVPTYGAEQGYVGSIAYVTCQTRRRMTEAESGAWTMGLRYRPLFLGFPDVPRNSSARLKATFVYEDVLRSIVQTYRKYHPVVVFAQDKDGEYGHWQHKLTSKAAVEAFTLAADPTYDPESAAAYGTWQVQKVYLHLYPIARLRINANAPLAAFGGKDAFEVAKEAYKKHVTQQKTSFAVRRNNGTYAFNQFGMAAGVVPAGSDVFDGISETLLSSYVPPTPSPTPEPADTPEPTDPPTQEPTPTASPEPTGTPGPSPAAGPKPAPRRGIPLWSAIAAGAVSLGLIGSGLWMMRKGKQE